MDSRWETSDAYYDARASSTSENFNDHLEEVADKPITCIDKDYLNLCRLLTGRSVKYEPHSLEDKQSVEQQTAVISGNPDPPEGDHDGVEEAADRRVRRNDLQENDAVRVPMSPRRIAELEDGTGTIKRKLCEASEGYNEVEEENGIESFERNYSEVKRPKKVVGNFENAMEEDAEKLMLSQKDMPEDCSKEGK